MQTRKRSGTPTKPAPPSKKAKPSPGKKMSASKKAKLSPCSYCGEGTPKYKCAMCSNAIHSYNHNKKCSRVYGVGNDALYICRPCHSQTNKVCVDCTTSVAGSNLTYSCCDCKALVCGFSVEGSGGDRRACGTFLSYKQGGSAIVRCANCSHKQYAQTRSTGSNDLFSFVP